MDVKRLSVLVLATAIILAFLASFINIQISPQIYGNIQIGSGGILGSYNITKPKYIYNKTIVLAPNIQDLEYVKGSYSNLPAPYYYIPNTTIPILFNFSTPENNTLNLLLNALAWNATKIAPKPYGALLSIASSAYVKIINYTNVTLQPIPLNPKDTENYSKWEIIVKYGKTLEAPSGFQSDWSYPPSDLITLNPLSYKITNKTTVQTSVIVSYAPFIYLENKNEIVKGNEICIYEYYAMEVAGTAYLYVNGKLASVQNFNYTFHWYGGQYGPNYLNATVTVPPGVQKEVYGSYTISAGSKNIINERENGNTTCIYYIYEPTGPYVSWQDYTFNWYEYNVTLPINIRVFNGTDPVTYVNNNTYNSRTINAVVWYAIWSSLPQNYSVNVLTRDAIQVANYTVVRKWHAGNVTIISNLVEQETGNVINYYLTFNLRNGYTRPPLWINQTMPYNAKASLAWFYLEQNASLAHALDTFITSTINKSDSQYWKFEYFVLAGEFTMYTFNTTYSVYNNLLELESFYENWSLVIANVLNLSAWPNIKYFNGILMFFNVSRIPPMYNVTIYFNISGNYEVYLVDIYNALYYKKWDKVPFGNEYYFYNPTTNQIIYFYLNTSRLPIPYINEPLDFESVNYIPYIFYGTFQYPTPIEKEITSIWNGTAWIS